ncbi:MAG: SNF2 family DNA or RNA helicase, partial [Myxococcota bacterium]
NAQLSAPAEDMAAPRTLEADLRPYQLDGLQFVARMASLGAGACLADDMGLGKTMQTLGLLLHRTTGGPALVIAPTSVCRGWLEEAWRFAPTLNMHLYGDGDREKMLAEAGPGDVVVCSYGLLQTSGEALSDIEWHTLVLDEAQAIKNRETKRHKAVRSLSADFRLGLTGTPIENSLSDLWSLFAVLNPGLLGGWESFKRRFVGPVESGDRDASAQLRNLVLPFILRRTKSAVLPDLPARTDITVTVDMSAEETALYEALRRKAVAELASDESSPIAVLAELTRLRLACCNPRLVVPAGDAAPESSKLLAFQEIALRLQTGGHRALVFSQFVKHLSLIREWLDASGVSYQYLDGSTPAAQRGDRVRAFQAGEGDLFLISLKAGGTGLNLTGADYVVHMDPWWNPAVEDQASDRAHRIGQTRPVTVYRLVMRGTVEERIVALHHRKRNLADQLLAGADTAKRLDKAALLALMSDSTE